MHSCCIQNHGLMKQTVDLYDTTSIIWRLQRSMEIKATICQSGTSSYEKVQIIFHGSFEDHHLSARPSKSAKYIWIHRVTSWCTCRVTNECCMSVSPIESSTFPLRRQDTKRWIYLVEQKWDLLRTSNFKCSVLKREERKKF